MLTENKLREQINALEGEHRQEKLFQPRTERATKPPLLDRPAEEAFAPARDSPEAGGGARRRPASARAGIGRRATLVALTLGCGHVPEPTLEATAVPTTDTSEGATPPESTTEDVPPEAGAHERAELAAPVTDMPAGPERASTASAAEASEPQLTVTPSPGESAN